MKKLIVVFLCMLLLLPSVALAEIDISGLSFDELVSLKQRIDLALWSADEWQAVTVPQGVYQIGVDIPAGHWTITADEGQSVSLTWGSKLDSSKKDIDYMGDIWVADNVVSSTYYFHQAGDCLQVDYDMSLGQYIVIQYGSAVFSPYTGKPNLGFK